MNSNVITSTTRIQQQLGEEQDEAKLWIENVVKEIRSDLLKRHEQTETVHHDSATSSSVSCTGSVVAINPMLHQRITQDIYVQKIVSPNDVMKYLIPKVIKLEQPSNTTAINENDTIQQQQPRKEESEQQGEALRILDVFLSLDKSGINNQENDGNSESTTSFALAASSTIKETIRILKQKLSTKKMVKNEPNALFPSLFVPQELLSILVHQACTSPNSKITQNCYDSIAFLVSMILSFQIIVESIVPVSPSNPVANTIGDGTTTIKDNNTIRNVILPTILSIWAKSVTIMKNNEHLPKKNTTLFNQQQSMISVRCTELMVDILVQICCTGGSSDGTTANLVLLDHTTVATIMTLIMDSIDPSSSSFIANDALFQISIYDLLYKLLSSLSSAKSTQTTITILDEYLFTNNHGFTVVVQPLLLRSGAMNRTCDNRSDDDNVDPYIQNSAMRVMIAICSRLTTISKQKRFQALTLDDNKADYDQLIVDMYTVLRNYDVGACTETERLQYIDAISSLVSISSPIILEHMLFQNNPNNIKNKDVKSLCDQWMNFTQTSQPKMKAAIVTSIANTIDPSFSDEGHNSPNATRLSDEVCMKLYNLVGKVNNYTNTTDFIIQHLQSSIVDIRYSCYRLLHSITKTKFGCQLILTNAVLCNLLLQRDTNGTYVEPSYEGRQLKYNIIVSLYNHPSIQHDILVSNDTAMKAEIEQYIQRGPHHKKVYQWDVSVAEQ